MDPTQTNTRLLVEGPDGPRWITVADLLALPLTTVPTLEPVATLRPIAPDPMMAIQPGNDAEDEDETSEFLTTQTGN